MATRSNRRRSSASPTQGCGLARHRLASRGNRAMVGGLAKSVGCRVRAAGPEAIRSRGARQTSMGSLSRCGGNYTRECPRRGKLVGRRPASSVPSRAAPGNPPIISGCREDLVKYIDKDPERFREVAYILLSSKYGATQSVHRRRHHVVPARIPPAGRRRPAGSPSRCRGPERAQPASPGARRRLMAKPYIDFTRYTADETTMALALTATALVARVPASKLDEVRQ